MSLVLYAMFDEMLEKCGSVVEALDSSLMPGLKQGGKKNSDLTFASHTVSILRLYFTSH